MITIIAKVKLKEYGYSPALYSVNQDYRIDTKQLILNSHNLTTYRETKVISIQINTAGLL